MHIFAWQICLKAHLSVYTKEEVGQYISLLHRENPYTFQNPIEKTLILFYYYCKSTNFFQISSEISLFHLYASKLGILYSVYIYQNTHECVSSQILFVRVTNFLFVVLNICIISFLKKCKTSKKSHLIAIG